MARARNIKPGFFTNDMLAECTPLARLLFAGLWLHCDREGRMEDRPKKIKAEILPYDSCDADALLGELEANGFIIRYAHEDRRYIQVTNFGKHQNPHIKESASEIPAPYKNSASTVQASDIPEPTGLNPSSPILNPESLTTTDASAPTEGGGGGLAKPDGFDAPNGAPLPPREEPDLPPNPALALTIALRTMGVNVMSTNPILLGWVDRGASVSLLSEAVRIAREHKGEASIPPQYLAPIVERLLNPPAERRGAGRAGGNLSQKFNFAHVDRSADLAMMHAGLAARGVTQADLDDDSPL